MLSLLLMFFCIKDDVPSRVGLESKISFSPFREFKYFPLYKLECVPTIENTYLLKFALRKINLPYSPYCLKIFHTIVSLDFPAYNFPYKVTLQTPMCR